MKYKLRLKSLLYFHTSASQYTAKWSNLIHTQFCPGVPQVFLQLRDELAQETEIAAHKKVLLNRSSLIQLTIVATTTISC